MSFSSLLLVFSTCSGFAQSPSASETLGLLYGFKIQKQVVNTKDGQEISWGNPQFPHLKQKFNQQGRLVEEQEFFPNSKKVQSVQKYFLNTQEKTFYSESTGKVDRIEKSEIKDKKIYTTFQDFKNNKTFTMVHDKKEVLEQQNEFCQPSPKAIDAIKSMQSFTKLFSGIKLLEQQGKYLNTTMGILVDPECILKDTNFLPTLQSAFGDGLACLKELNTRKTDVLISKMASVLDNPKNPLKILCSETGYDWAGTVAHASFSEDKEHPFISINPKMMDPTIKGTLFHELFHSCGYFHSVHPEVAYTCESCCMEKLKKPHDYQKKANQFACDLCKGDYQDVTSIDYLTKFTEWAENGFSEKPRKYIMDQLAADQTPSKDKMRLFLRNLGIFQSYDVTLIDSIQKTFTTANPSLLPQKPNSSLVIIPSLKPSTDEFASALVSLSEGNKQLSMQKLVNAWKSLPKEPPTTISEKKDFEAQEKSLRALYKDVAFDLRFNNKDDKFIDQLYDENFRKKP